MRRASVVIACIAVAAGGAAPASSAQTARPVVHVIATGGTISNTGGNGQSRLTGEELVSSIPKLKDVATVTAEQFTNVSSGAITVDNWRALAKRIRTLEAAPNAPAGFVVTHGTDTMEETAYFLDLTVGGCTPVVVTGAMRRPVDVGPDGPANLYNAVRVAAARDARGRGAMVLMNDVIFAARDVTKSNTTRTNAFSGPDGGTLGVADPDSVVFQRPPPAICRHAPFDVDSLGNIPRVDVVPSYVGADSIVIDALVNAGAKGLVIAGVGRGGNTPAQGRAMQRAVDRGVIIVISNRTGSGRVGSTIPDSVPNTPGRGARIAGGDLNPQKARILLMLALARSKDPRAVAEIFRVN
jgi:L-asparaginase